MGVSILSSVVQKGNQRNFAHLIHISTVLSLEGINSSKFHGFYLLCVVCSDLENHNRFIVLSSRKQIITNYP